MEAECDTGNIEYKLKLLNLCDERLKNLVTQMRYRCQEGNGECIYNLGVEDDGSMSGITEEEYEETINNINLIAGKNNYSVKLLTVIPVQNNKKIYD